MPPEIADRIAAPILALTQRLDEVKADWVSISVEKVEGRFRVRINDLTDVQ